LLSAVTVHWCVVSAVQAVGSSQSRRGPGRTRSTGADDGARTGATSTNGSSPRSVPTGSRSPAFNGRGPRPESVSVLRDPSTGGTSTPPRTAR
jgi:hypothetical protein